MNKKPRVVVFFGGTSGNHDLSEATGHWVCQYVPREKYQVSPVHITEDGQWQVPLGTLPQTGDAARAIAMLLAAVPAVSPTAGLQRLMHTPADALFTVVRGAGGDDGSLHGLGQTLAVPVVGSPGHTCATTSDKHASALATQEITATPHLRRWRRHVPVEEIMDEVRQEFTPPLFIKPANQEGSFGVSQVRSLDSLRQAVNHAREQGDVIAQEHTPGQEISLTLIQDVQGKLHALPPTIIFPQKAPFYDALAKRRAGRVKLHTSSDANNPILAEAEMIARDVWDQLSCQGIAQLDFIAGDDGLHLLEVNTVPTATATTPLIHQLRAASLHPAAILDNLVSQAIR